MPHQKAEVVDAVCRGHLSLDRACERHALSVEEFLSWKMAIETAGLAGLRLSEIKRRRRDNERRAGD